MMKIVPVRISQQVESTPKLLDHSMEKDLKPKFFSVDRDQRWPVQGWTSGNRYILNKDSAEELAEEAKRAFTVNRKSRWPLQGWCKAPTVDHSSAECVRRASKYGAQSRWPQGCYTGTLLQRARQLSKMMDPEEPDDSARQEKVARRRRSKIH